MVIEKSMTRTTVEVTPYNYTRRVDPARSAGNGTREIDGAEHAMVIEKPMTRTTVGVIPHNCALRVDPGGTRGNGGRKVNGGKIEPSSLGGGTC